MGTKVFPFLLMAGSIVLPALAQSSAPTAACGDPAARFDVKQSKATDPAQPPPGQALVFVIEKDLTARVFATPTTRFGIDGNWAGATHGDSHFSIAVSPGEHHLCAFTQFGGVGGAGQAFAHFTAEAGTVYYFEVRNTRVGAQSGEELDDVVLIQPDDDQGKYLVAATVPQVSQIKK